MHWKRTSASRSRSLDALQLYGRRSASALKAVQTIDKLASLREDNRLILYSTGNTWFCGNADITLTPVGDTTLTDRYPGSNGLMNSSNTSRTYFSIDVFKLIAYHRRTKGWWPNASSPLRPDPAWSIGLEYTRLCQRRTPDRDGDGIQPRKAHRRHTGATSPTVPVRMNTRISVSEKISHIPER